MNHLQSTAIFLLGVLQSSSFVSSCCDAMFLVLTFFPTDLMGNALAGSRSA